MVAKRKIAFQQAGKGYENPPQVQPKTVRRNARERSRVKNIDVGFDKLKMHIPTTAQQKKISRVKILSHAVDYIQHLHTLLNEHESVCGRNPNIVKQEPSSPSLPKPANVGQDHQVVSHLPYTYPAPHYPQMYNQQPPLMQPHNPISPGYLPPHNNYETNSVTSSGYYSEHPSQLSPVPSQLSPPVHQYGTPGYRGDGLAFNRDNGYSRESLSPSSHSTYSDSSVHSAFVPTTPNTANMIKDDENIIHDILEWEKY